MSASTKMTLSGLFLIFPLFLKSQNLNQFIQLLPAEDGLIFGINNRTTVQSLVSSTDGLYILTEKDGCYFLTGESMEKLSLLSVPKDRRDLYTGLLTFDKSVYLWANHHQFLNLDQPSDERLEFVGEHFNKNVSVTDIDVDKYGRVFVATANNGLFIFRKDESGEYTGIPLRISTVDKQLPSNNVNCLYRDEEDVLWIGTDEGVSTMKENIIINLSRPKEIIKPKWWQRLLGISVQEDEFEEPVQLITSWGDCILLVNKEGFYKADRQYDELVRLYEYNISDALTSPIQDITSVMVDIDANIWLAGDQLLMYDLTNNQLFNVSENMPFKGRKFLTITEDVHAKSIWIGMEHGGLYEYYDDGEQRQLNFISLQSNKF